MMIGPIIFRQLALSVPSPAMALRRAVLVAIAALAALSSACGSSETTSSSGEALATGALATSDAFTVTYIGDSHSDYEGNAVGAFGYLGYHLKELMAQDGIPLSLYAASGSSPAWWFDDAPVQAATWGYSQTVPDPPRTTCRRGSKTGTCVPKLGVLTSKHPKLFVIEQGTNLLGLADASIKSQIQKMLQQIAGKVDACLWVAAPNARTSVHSQASQDALWKLVHDNAAPTCTVYDSRFLPRTDATGQPVLDAQGNLIMDVPLPYSPDANNDGEHFGKVAAGKWAEGVALMIEHLRPAAAADDPPPDSSAP
jgi:hypothetical protein